MPGGQQPCRGGWNRFVLAVADLEATVTTMRATGIAWCNDVVTVPGGKQILVEDPLENPIERFQAK